MPPPLMLPKPVVYTLKNGSKVTIRAFSVRDRHLVLEMFQSLTSQTRRNRFFGAQKYVTEEVLVSESHIESGKVVAIVAEYEERGSKQIIGDCRLYLDDEGKRGEFSIVISDPWQQKGLGAKMTAYMLDIAQSRGTRGIYAYVLTDNVVMLHIFVGHEFTKKIHDDHYFLEKSL